MNNACPVCGKTYPIGPQHIGRTFTCKQCQARLVIEPEGLALLAETPEVTAEVVRQSPRRPFAPWS